MTTDMSHTHETINVIDFLTVLCLTMLAFVRADGVILVLHICHADSSATRSVATFDGNCDFCSLFFCVGAVRPPSGQTYVLLRTPSMHREKTARKHRSTRFKTNQSFAFY